MGDISHIPVDPVVNVLPVLKPGVLSLLCAARRSGLKPQDKVGVTMIMQRLTILRERLNKDQVKGPGTGSTG